MSALNREEGKGERGQEPEVESRGKQKDSHHQRSVRTVETHMQHVVQLDLIRLEALAFQLCRHARADSRKTLGELGQGVGAKDGGTGFLLLKHANLSALNHLGWRKCA